MDHEAWEQADLAQGARARVVMLAAGGEEEALAAEAVAGGEYLFGMAFGALVHLP